MRTWVNALRQRARASDGDEGFTLVEVMVALLIFAVAAQSLAYSLITSAVASTRARSQTTAKNLAQQRIEAMRTLPYHVDAQNGPYVDLLDLYFHDDSGAADSLPDVVQGAAVSGQYVSTGGSGGPAGPYYHVTIPGSLLGSAYAAYTVAVYSQFLVASSPAATPLTASALPSGYNNSAVGADQPPSPLLGVTVVVSWQRGAVTHRYTTFTEITSQGTGTSLVVSQAKAVALDVATKDYLANAITANIASATVNGSLSNGSRAGAQADGASVNYAVDPAVEIHGAQATAVAPPNPSGTSGSSLTVAGQHVGALAGCGTTPGWSGFGQTQTADASATTANGLPLAPADASASNGTPAAGASLVGGGAGDCSAFWLTNQVEGSPVPTYTAQSMVEVQDRPSGSTDLVGQSSTYTSAVSSAAGAVRATASAAVSTWVKILPGLTLPGGGSLPAPPSDWEINGSPGLVNVSLQSATLSCLSQPGGTTTATLNDSGSIAWYTSSGWHRAWFSFPNSPLAAVDLTQPLDATGVPLSSYIASVSTATGITGDNGGVQSVDAVLAVATTPTLGAAYPWTGIDVQLGQLSCVAQDNRS